MKAVIQRVKKASVKIEEEIVGKIETGILILLAIHKDDQEDNLKKMADKILKLRIFGDKNNKMNLSLKDVKAEILVVSQFTLYADCQRGNRPNFVNSAQKEKAQEFYSKFITYLREKGQKVQTGKFGAMMQVSLINDGPVTIIMDF